jgi:heme-degrading monooxygenase HmoA
MYVTVRKYADKGALIGGLVTPVRDGFVPLLRRAPGFRGYCAFASEDGHVVSVTLFDDRQTAMRAEDRVRDWVVSNLRDLLPTLPEVVAGEVLLHREARLQGGGPGMFVAIRVYDGVGPEDGALPTVRERIFPAVTGAPGFRGYYAFLDDADASRGVSVSLFDTREHATAAQERAVAAMRDPWIAPNPPRVMAGQTAVVVAAES